MNLLEWETASESDNKEFVVERKSINAAFTELARIAGAGTSEGPNLYSFTDTNPEYGFNYYRLKQIDFDGQFVYSPIRVVYLDKEVREIFIWPNPVSDVFTVYFDKGGELSILNAQGQMCYSRIFDKEFSHSVDISSFPTGLYILGLKTTDGIFSKKLFRK